MVESDEDAPGAGQELLMLLASEYAEGSYIDLRTAYAGLRGALQAAADMRARGNIPDNTGGQFQAVMAEVTRLNEEGDRDGAAAALDDAQTRVEQEYEAIFDQQLNQDRLRNRPADAAKRHFANLHRQAPPGGVWQATRDLLHETKERGEREGDPFDLRVALELAEYQWKKAKGPKRLTVLADLGLCHLSLGKVFSDSKNLRISLKAFRGSLKLVSKKSDPNSWGAVQNNLGIALELLGDREEDSIRLLEAVGAYEKALTVRNKETTPADWATTQNNLGGALRMLGEREEDNARLLAAVDAYQNALTVHTKEATPENWAMTQSNLGNGLRALGARDEDTARLSEAVRALEKSLTVYKENTAPRDWAMAQMNRGLAFRWLGQIEREVSFLDRAAAAYELVLQVETRDTDPFGWAKYQWNLADLALARHGLVPDPALPMAARAYVMAAREVFAEGSEHQTERCDELLAQIDAAEAKL